jgi:FixJ family two-component response regulator
MNTTPTVYIVDDDAAVRDSLQILIEPLRVRVQACGDASSFLHCFDPNGIGCVILDVRMPGLSGLELQARMVEHGWQVPIIFVSGHADVRMSARAFKAGAFDFLEKPFNRQELIDVLQRAIGVDQQRHEEKIRQSAAHARLALLSERERQVLELVLQGNINKQIADALHITVRTVEAHRANLMAKMHAGSVLELGQMMAMLGAVRTL